jgi:hypothetical protein
VKTKPLAACLLLTASLIVVSLPLAAQTAKRSRIVHTPEKSAARMAPQAVPDGLKVIYSSLGPKNDPYLDTDGWYITGFNSYGGDTYAFAIALPFTPRSNSHVSQVRVPVQYAGSGANQVNLSLYSDTNGVPGTLLAGPVTVTNLAETGTCCALTIADFAPLAVTAGTQYWVVADTPASGQGSDFVGAWDFESKVMTFGGTNGSDGWYAENGDSEPAGEVLGTVP